MPPSLKVRIVHQDKFGYLPRDSGVTSFHHVLRRRMLMCSLRVVTFKDLSICLASGLRGREEQNRDMRNKQPETVNSADQPSNSSELFGRRISSKTIGSREVRI
ncbi:hypothetical protein ACFE04_019821 [Oxalis oulophora]